MAKVIFLLMVATMVAVVPAKAGKRHANNLNASEQVIKAKDGKSAFKRTMVGTDNTALGVPLPSGMTKDELSTLVLGTHFDKLKKDELSGLAAVPFPGRPGLFIGAGGLKKYDDANYYNAHVHLSLVIFKIESPHSFSVVAKTTQPLQFDQGKNLAGDWNPDQTRQHVVFENKYTVAISPTMHDGYHDLVVRQSLGGRYKAI